ncbi:hypothetical protein VNO78_02082 [Psophocarpus tetragonolobus]|uniref:NAC domain-containing protein n=1 Tax=Psophocarpus tetragonolobus TaxID=3891 RepID=A0AAN9TAZ3_PSOTE
MAGKDSIPGYRFRPTDVELIQYFLKRKVQGKKIPSDVITELDLYKYAPWDLPDLSLLKTGDLDWYFFCSRGKKYSTGGRVNRATEAGYWKTTGKDRAIEHMNRVVGMIKTLVFHSGKAPKGDRTDWVMHEFRLEDKELADRGVPQDSYVICRIFQKEGPGPRNGAQYGKPFKDEDWDTEEEIDSAQPAPAAAVSAPVPIKPGEIHISVVNDIHPSTSECVELTSCRVYPSAPNNQVDSVSCVSEMMPSCLVHPSAPKNQVDSVSCVPELMPSCLTHPSAPNNQLDSVSCVSELVPSYSAHPSAPNNQVGSISCVSESVPSCSAHPSAPNNQADDDILSLLDCFKDIDTLVANENNGKEKVDDLDLAKNVPCAPCSDPNTIFGDLGDLDSFFGLGEDCFSCGQKNEYLTSEMLYTGNIFGSFDPQYCLELTDLEKPQLLHNKDGSGSQDM